MDLRGLPDLGKVAGVPGIALGVAALILGAVLALTEALPEPWRGPLLTVVVIGALLLSLLAVIGWMRGREQFARAEGTESEARNRDGSQGGGRQEAIARGKSARAINERK
jgi:hypothetical protein